VDPDGEVTAIGDSEGIMVTAAGLEDEEVLFPLLSVWRV